MYKFSKYFRSFDLKIGSCFRFKRADSDCCNLARESVKEIMGRGELVLGLVNLTLQFASSIDDAIYNFL
jgi:hypothetical protein